MKALSLFLVGVVTLIAGTAHHSLSNDIHEPTKVGSGAPQIVANTISGEGILKDQFSGKLRLVVFWSIKSEETVAHIPLLKTIRKRHQNEDDFMMVSVSTGDEWEDWCQFQEKQGIVGYGEERCQFPFYSDHRWFQLHEIDFMDESSSKLFGVVSLPSAYLIDRDGEIAAVLNSLNDLESKVDAFLKEQSSVAP